MEELGSACGRVGQVGLSSSQGCLVMERVNHCDSVKRAGRPDTSLTSLSFARATVIAHLNNGRRI